jgi:hypothetical protein
MEKILLKSMDFGLTKQVAAVIAEVTRRTTGENRDDATIVAFEVLLQPAS